MSTINMQTMRYINLLDKTSRVKTTKCFMYGNTIIFAVPNNMISQAIGPDALNVRRIQEKLGKRVKIIKEASGLEDVDRFVKDIVSPVRFKSIESKDGMLVLNAGGTQGKATLIGRDKRRLQELDQILKDTFGMELKIV